MCFLVTEQLLDMALFVRKVIWLHAHREDAKMVPPEFILSVRVCPHLLTFSLHRRFAREGLPFLCAHASGSRLPAGPAVKSRRFPLLRCLWRSGGDQFDPRAAAALYLYLGPGFFTLPISIRRFLPRNEVCAYEINEMVLPRMNWWPDFLLIALGSVCDLCRSINTTRSSQWHSYVSKRAFLPVLLYVPAMLLLCGRYDNDNGDPGLSV